MLKSIYTPLSGAISQEKALDVIANNLANVNTVGFKGDGVSFTLLEPEPYKSYKSPLPPANYKEDLLDLQPFKGNDLAYVGVDQVYRDMSQGTAISTRNPTDLMIEGQGFFTVKTTEGMRYTRNGAFSINQNGALTTKSGDPIQGMRGDIYLRQGEFHVNSRGEIHQNGQFVDRIKVAEFAEDNSLERIGNNLWFYRGAPEDITEGKSYSLSQGMLEGSNVNAVKNITAMIIAHRSYEAYQKAIKNYDSMMDKSSNNIGLVRA